MKSIEKKNIILLCDTTSKYSSSQIINFLSKQKYFIISYIFFSNNSEKDKISILLKKFSYPIKSSKTITPVVNKNISEIIKKKNIEICISTSFPKKISKSFISLFKIGVINMHPSVLPKNRGSHHAFWGIYNNNFHGCTMHFMTEKLDNGPIIDQIKYKNNKDLTASQVFKKSHDLKLHLLKKNIKNIYLNSFKIKKQSKEKSTYHTKEMINQKINLHVNKKIKIDELWRIIKGTNIKDHGFFINTKNNKYKIISKIKKIK